MNKKMTISKDNKWHYVKFREPDAEDGEDGEDDAI
jgi:hypothetical protein